MDMVDPQPTLVALLVRHVLLPCEFMPQIGINSNEGGVPFNHLAPMRGGVGDSPPPTSPQSPVRSGALPPSLPQRAGPGYSRRMTNTRACPPAPAQRWRRSR